MESLFTLFGKLQRTASLNSEGLGLGLRICKQIVEQNGGKIYVESDGVDKGSCFTFSMLMDKVDANSAMLVDEVDANSESLLEQNYANGNSTLLSALPYKQNSSTANATR